MRRIGLALLLVAALPLFATDITREDFSMYFGNGKSVTSWHGQASFRSLRFELTGRSPYVESWIPKARVGISLAYHDIRQARSWFGYRDGDPNDSVRGMSSYLFVRRGWRDEARLQPYIEVGSGPMWSNRRVPAATSRFNFNSQLGLGLRLYGRSMVVARFAHISNFGITGRNPGLNVSSLMVGARLRRSPSTAHRARAALQRPACR